MYRAIRIHEKDNVAVAVVDCIANVEIAVQGPQNTSLLILSIEDIQFGHKIALDEIYTGDIITKYGRPIGRATEHIFKGGLVGVHNIEGLRGRGDLRAEGGLL